VLDITLELGSFYLLKPYQSLFGRSFLVSSLILQCILPFCRRNNICKIIIIPNEQTIKCFFILILISKTSNQGVCCAVASPHITNSTSMFNSMKLNYFRIYLLPSGYVIIRNNNKLQSLLAKFSF